ncbi:uncharacterized protein PV06_00350 [Exophiala oligosperma]|uniref:Xylanolytic transcriptional activator regulatory domain-containing protein n=1 Tax=Exophiala oligosperma TaxID=215243 RepID=A0A0D2DYL0_9EURO|nr:uncharacterized protein PV06_00350 [Exophiala oligosperma]KIW47680.1 hypothetical protein PV06_00350 [Exophiala oligosperma]
MDDRNFVFLMSLIWGLGAHYIWANPATSSSMPIPTSLLAEMMKVVDVAYSRITASPTLETVQIAILLGSFHLFNGSPYLGFAIFGSGVRCAQAIGLHRQPRTSSSTGESCLVWWALEISDKYAAVAFGLPCGVDDSDCDVPEINDKDKSQPDDPVSSINLTYHKLKGRLYRIMGPFLGRKKQTNQLRSLLHVRRELKEWHASVPEWLKCSTDSPEFNRRPTQVQMQAVALQLAYDNLQMVLFRQAAFPRNRWEYPVDRHQAEAIKDLSEAAIRTASISTFAAARLICQSSHAAMHVAICSFTAGVILSLMIASQPNDPESSTQLESLKNIINLFEQFPSQNYRLATQSLTLLKALEFRVDPQLAQGSGEDIRFSNRHSLHYQPKRNNPGPVQDLAMMGEDNNNTPNTATNILEFNFGDLGFSSNAGGPLDDVGQLWLWDDLSNENWMPNFQ